MAEVDPVAIDRRLALVENQLLNAVGLLPPLAREVQAIRADVAAALRKEVPEGDATE